jgi:hypothetical protein
MSRRIALGALRWVVPCHQDRTSAKFAGRLEEGFKALDAEIHAQPGDLHVENRNAGVLDPCEGLTQQGWIFRKRREVTASGCRRNARADGL